MPQKHLPVRQRGDGIKLPTERVPFLYKAIGFNFYENRQEHVTYSPVMVDASIMIITHEINLKRRHTLKLELHSSTCGKHRKLGSCLTRKR